MTSTATPPTQTTLDYPYVRGDNQLRCPDCPRTYRGKGSLQGHHRKFHRAQTGVTLRFVPVKGKKRARVGAWGEEEEVANKRSCQREEEEEGDLVMEGAAAGAATAAAAPLTPATPLIPDMITVPPLPAAAARPQSPASEAPEAPEREAAQDRLAGMMTEEAVRTALQGVRRASEEEWSVIDAIKTVRGKDAKHASQVCARIIHSLDFGKLEISVKLYQFPGAGSRPTPVTSFQGIMHILTLLPGKEGKHFQALQHRQLQRLMAERAEPAAAPIAATPPSTPSHPQPPTSEASEREAAQDRLVGMMTEEEIKLAFQSVRRTPEDDWSIIDSITEVRGKDRADARKVWTRIYKHLKSETLKILIEFTEFPGFRGGPTPVTSFQGIMHIMALLPGKHGKHFQARYRDFYCRAAAGDADAKEVLDRRNARISATAQDNMMRGLASTPHVQAEREEKKADEQERSSRGEEVPLFDLRKRVLEVFPDERLLSFGIVPVYLLEGQSGSMSLMEVLKAVGGMKMAFEEHLSKQKMHAELLLKAKQQTREAEKAADKTAAEVKAVTDKAAAEVKAVADKAVEETRMAKEAANKVAAEVLEVPTFAAAALEDSRAKLETAKATRVFAEADRAEKQAAKTLAAVEASKLRNSDREAKAAIQRAKEKADHVQREERSENLAARRVKAAIDRLEVKAKQAEEDRKEAAENRKKAAEKAEEDRKQAAENRKKAAKKAEEDRKQAAENRKQELHARAIAAEDEKLRVAREREELRRKQKSTQNRQLNKVAIRKARSKVPGNCVVYACQMTSCEGNACNVFNQFFVARSTLLGGLDEESAVATCQDCFMKASSEQGLFVHDLAPFNLELRRAWLSQSGDALSMMCRACDDAEELIYPWSLKHLSHLQADANGGSRHALNLAILHPTCNGDMKTFTLNEARKLEHLPPLASLGRVITTVDTLTFKSLVCELGKSRVSLGKFKELLFKCKGETRRARMAGGTRQTRLDGFCRALSSSSSSSSSSPPSSSSMSDSD